MCGLVSDCSRFPLHLQQAVSGKQPGDEANCIGGLNGVSIKLPCTLTLTAAPQSIFSFLLHYSPVYTGPPLEVDSNPDSGPRSTGGLSYLDCDLD